MSSSVISKKVYSELPAYSIPEILRYLGTKTPDKATLSLIEDCIAECSGKLNCRAVFREFDLTRTGDTLELGFAKVCSADLFRNLAGCNRIFLFAATLGAEADRLIAKHTRLSPARALVLDAVLTERIEALCDRLEAELTEGKSSRPRFSAGYGDLPIELQKDIFAALDCERKIGLTLGEGMLMSPSKSVTAIIGLA